MKRPVRAPNFSSPSTDPASRNTSITQNTQYPFSSPLPNPNPCYAVNQTPSTNIMPQIHEPSPLISQKHNYEQQNYQRFNVEDRSGQINFEYLRQKTYKEVFKQLQDFQRSNLKEELGENALSPQNLYNYEESRDKYLVSQMRYYDPTFRPEDQLVFTFRCVLYPEDQRINWTIWKHMKQIRKFLEQMQKDINGMRLFKKRMGQIGPDIIGLYEQLHSRRGLLNQMDMPYFTNFLNLLGAHFYMKKNWVFLTFVSHCMPLHLWNLKVYQQVPIYENPNLLTQLFVSPDSIRSYLTVTADGVIMSTKNPMDTRVEQMIPFTNQFKFRSDIQRDGDLYFNISSCFHESHTVNFKKDYRAGLNFHLGMSKALKESHYDCKNRFNSFSKKRQNCSTKLYADGQKYFEDLCAQLLLAKRQVLITDWWMTPYILLRREKDKTDIKEVQYRLDGVLKKIGDRGVKVYIILFRQPLAMLCNDSQQCKMYLQALSSNIKVVRHPILPQRWSHHEKCVIIDQRVGFMGGLDLCYGRWDTHKHSVVDKHGYWNGGDYVNERIKSYEPGTTHEYQKPPIDRKTQPRMPWHDIGIQLRGDAVMDLARHFVQYWYFTFAEKDKDPYHYKRAIQQRWERTTNYVEPVWSAAGYDVTKQHQQRNKTVGQYFTSCGVKTQLFFTGTELKLPELLVEVGQGRQVGTQQLQICRSASNWSIGAQQTERSIQNAYLDMIDKSEHHIYIENQFFMGEQHEIFDHLTKRIIKAHHNWQQFKVIVVMPLLPGFEGEVSDRANVPLRIQIKNTYRAINRGPNSLQTRLAQQNITMEDYIFFFGLRNHDILQGTPVTEMIYVHSKLMIVDDKRAIIGSANINDRSLMGDRDSELAIVVEENNGNVSTPDVGTKQIFQFRCSLYEQHFGLTPDQCDEITSPQVWQKVINRSKSNTLLYRQVFGCYPDDTITVAEEIEICKQEANLARYHQLMPKIEGHAVELPLHFLEDDDLEFQALDKEQLFVNGFI